MGAQPTRLYTELGSEWIEKVHNSKDDPETRKAKHLELVFKIEEELEELEKLITEGSAFYGDLNHNYSGIENPNATRALILIESCIQRDLETCIVALKDYLNNPNNTLESMHQQYKTSLPNFNEMAAKYILEYNFHKYETAFKFWVDGNLHYLDINHPAWKAVK